MRRVALVSIVLVLASAGQASAATQLGATFVPTTACDPASTNLTTTSPQPTQYTVPFDGVITSWSYQADLSPSAISFKIARSAGANSFTIVGGSGLQSPTPGNLHTSEIQASVLAGDVIGIYTQNNECGRSGTGFATVYRPGDSPLGTAATYFGPADYQLDVSARLEPDCDADGKGDETQDFDLRSCPPGPEVTITEGPRDTVKTKRKRKRVTFEFSSLEPATFECALDGANFAACTSPQQLKVKRGAHVFEVRALDAGGNAGAPATDEWKVKRKR